MKNGKVDKIFKDKGYGFIAVGGGKLRYFFHISDCVTDFESLEVGDDVKFDTTLSEKGPRATEVERE